MILKRVSLRLPVDEGFAGPLRGEEGTLCDRGFARFAGAGIVEVDPARLAPVSELGHFEIVANELPAKIGCLREGENRVDRPARFERFIHHAMLFIDEIGGGFSFSDGGHVFDSLALD